MTAARIRRGVIDLLVCVIVLLLLAEGLLRLFDPLGAAFFADIERLGLASVPDDIAGYHLTAGHYALHGWSLTELPGGVRATPASAPSGCTLLIVGDSVAFGQGVNDDATFANHLAASLSLRVINAAFEGYNSRQALDVARSHPDADIVLYLIWGNDMDPAWHFERPAPASQIPMLSLYTMALWSTARPAGKALEAVRFWQDLDDFAHDPRVVLVAFDDPFGRAVAARYPVQLMPMYRGRVSYFDGHPDAESHRQMALTLLPVVREARLRRCTAVF